MDSKVKARLAEGGSRSIEAIASYEAFERQLAGKAGELIVLYYEAETPAGTGKFFRYGQLDGEELIWDEEAGITLPVSGFFGGPEGSFNNLVPEFEKLVLSCRGNIFGKYSELEHSPPPLGSYIVARLVPRAPMLQIFVGEKQANRYFVEYEGFKDLDPFLKRLERGEHLTDDFLRGATDAEMAGSDEL